MNVRNEELIHSMEIAAQRDPILVERERSHGKFEVTAYISQQLKRFLHDMKRDYSGPVSDVQAEALDMMAVKMARILAGDPRNEEHWVDIAGYAKLGGEGCE